MSAHDESSPSRGVREPSGRPKHGEFAAYALSDIERVEGDDALAALAAGESATLALLAPLTEERVRGLTYATGKWTLKQVVGHMADDERIFGYRALCVARGDQRPLPGFDQDVYMRRVDFESRTLADLLDEYRAVRRASIALFASMTPESWLRTGIVNGYEASVRGLAFHIAGHEMRHLRSLRELYLSVER